MKKILFIFSLLLFIVNCSKSSDPKSETEQEVDVSEGQTNWTKYDYWDITKDSNYGNIFWSIGVNDIAIQGDTIVMVGSLALEETTSIIWRSTDQGKTWSVVGGGGCGAGNRLIQIEFVSNNLVYALRDRCLGDGGLLKSVDAGATWSRPLRVRLYHNFTPGTNSTDFTKPMHFFTEEIGILESFKTIDGGITWNGIPDLAPFSDMIFSIVFLNDTIGYCTTPNAVLKTVNAGENWTILHENDTVFFRDVLFLNENLGFLSTNSELLKTTDGGLTWASVLSTVVRDISFATDQIGFVATSDGIYKTKDQGESWQLNYTSDLFNYAESFPSDDYSGLNAIKFDGENVGIAAGHQIQLDNLPNEKAYIMRTTTLGEE